MNRTLSGVRLVTVAGLIAGAVGMVVQRVAGVNMPVVPPGLVLLVGSALLIAFTGWRWTPALGALIGLSEAAAIVATGQLAVLADVTSIGVFLGTWIRTIGVVVASVAGVLATVAAYRSRTA
ncbi:hypothetical protein FE391_34775 [Nonomuraea sp. KC401]|uniref:hypothetical protein n=1 Tax=unclassified Nonomuraea TaxID=2593643 RepID=UPI0010FEE56A|nr:MULTISPECIES: hypothetical protein [unclassified Nonomuraea]NBE96959.1 hypothetical protein [Nonomuraea sp. K271]TLF59618.1 hypothetical protein FE391_34775 [Nonomuraea sp. KC401]